MLLLGEPVLGEGEKAALAAVVDGGWITMGARVRAFEQAFAETHGTRDAVAVSSCTAGLHLLLTALGIGPGDEVLVPSLTFVATANCILHVGATPVFVDIEALDRPLISADDAARKCTRRTKAIILVHYAGYLPDRAPWQDFARSRELLLLEDAAHAAGVEGAGSIGEAGVFSFFGNKNMTTAEGGMVVARDDGLLERIRLLRSHGMTGGPLQRLNGRNRDYDVTELGFNYRMDEFRASVGLVQLASLPRWNAIRSSLTAAYQDALARDCPEIALPFPGRHRSAHHILPVLLPDPTDRRGVMDAMHARGIQTAIHYPPVHEFTLYRERLPAVRLPRTEEFTRRELTLPLHPRMTGQDVAAVTAALALALARPGRRG